MSAWISITFTIMGVVIVFGVMIAYMMYQNRTDVKGKVWVWMRTISGTRDDFLAEYEPVTEESGFIVVPRHKNAYLESISKMMKIKTKDKGLPTNYIYLDDAVTSERYPIRHGPFRFMSAPVNAIEFNEGNPIPIGRKQLDRDGKYREITPYDSGPMIAMSRDETWIGGMLRFDAALEEERGKMAKFAEKFIHPMFHHIYFIITVLIVGFVLYNVYMIADKVDDIAKGLGL